MRIRGSAFLFFTVLAVLSFPAGAVSLKTDTLRVQKTTTPGSQEQGVITVMNDEETVLNVQVGLLDFHFDDEKQANRSRPFNTQEKSCAPWIQLSDKSIQLPPKSSHALQYIIRVPEEDRLDHAEYHAMIYIESLVSKPDLTGKLVLASKARMLIVVQLRIEGKAAPSGEITAFHMDKNPKNDSFQITYGFKNTGNCLNKVSGAFSIIDAEGNLYGRGTLPYAYASPGKEVTITSPWDGSLDPGQYDVVAEFRYQRDQVDIREYRLVVE
jgi:hypothetical protein